MMRWLKYEASLLTKGMEVLVRWSDGLHAHCKVEVEDGHTYLVNYEDGEVRLMDGLTHIAVITDPVVYETEVKESDNEKLHRLFLRVGASKYVGRHCPQLVLECQGKWSLDLIYDGAARTVVAYGELYECLHKAENHECR